MVCCRGILLASNNWFPRKKIHVKEINVKMGHLGQDITLTRDRFYWPKIKDGTKHFALKVCNCVKSTEPNIVPVAIMQSISSSEPLELIGLDFLHLHTCSGGYLYFLVITCLVQVYAATHKSTKTVVGRLYNDFVLRYGIHGKILNKQGKKFENNPFIQLSKLVE